MTRRSMLLLPSGSLIRGPACGEIRDPKDRLG
jgi:hypothetical protein